MRHLMITAAAALLVTACAPSQNNPGQVYEVTEHTVTIRGAFAQGTTRAKPTAAMNATAERICPGAQYLSANPTPSDLDTFLYLYRCPNGPA